MVDTINALSIARERGYDLVEVSAKSRPPVCRLLDYGKYKYRLMKEAQKQKKRQKKLTVKGVRISLRISKHDFEFKARQADKFIKQGHKVRVELILHGREHAHADLARQKLKEFIETMEEKVQVEQEPKKERLGLAIVITKTA